VTSILLRAPAVALAFGALAFGQSSAPPVKVGIIYTQQAVAQTKEGQKAAAEMNLKFGPDSPKRKQLESKQSELAQLEQQYKSGESTMADDAKQKLTREIDQRRKQLQRDVDDAQAELDAERGRVMQTLGPKMMDVLNRYATERGFALVLDLSSPQTPVLYASNSIDITGDIVELYDKQQAGASAAPAPAPKPAAAKPAAPKPAAVSRAK
jgi:outer membrane protein